MMTDTKTGWPADDGLAFARALLLAAFVITPIATSWEVVIEIAAYAVVLIKPEPRRRAIDALRNPVVIGALPLAAMIIVGTFHGPATWSDALVSLVAWRRMLLLPLGSALFFDAPSKRLVSPSKAQGSARASSSGATPRE